MKLAVVTSGFPRRSETFALNEMLALDAAGALEVIFATKPGDGSRHPGVERLMDRVRVLRPGSAAEQAAEVVQCLDGITVSGVHAYFAHLPAEVAAIAATKLGCPFGFSTHALDARKVPAAELAERARGAACVIACNPDVAREFEAVGATVRLIPHGVDLSRFEPTPLPANGRLSVLAVGRLVEKKGLSVLVEAVGRVRAPVLVRIVGDGPLKDSLTDQIARLGLDDRVRLVGPRTHAELPQDYAAAHVVVVPSVVDAAGDRDGLPNVVLEAMASQRPVVASDVGAVSSAVIDGASGMLLAAGDVGALADAIEMLAAQPVERERLARGGRALVERQFELGACTGRLLDELETIYG